MDRTWWSSIMRARHGEEAHGIQNVRSVSRNFIQQRRHESVNSSLRKKCVKRRGADTLAGIIAEQIGLQVEVYPADWNRHGQAAGPIRNQQMLDQGRPDIVLAFHANISQSKGTKDPRQERLKDSASRKSLGVLCVFVCVFLLGVRRRDQPT
jgi:hypothetical protein